MKPNTDLVPERIEFESDGVIDSLTHALAPARFQDILATELSKAFRSGEKITMVSAKCRLFGSFEEKLGNDSGMNNDPTLKRDLLKIESFNKVSRKNEIEEELKSFAETISGLLRSGDEIGRLSEDGFWILIHGEGAAAQRAVRRFGESINQESWELQICESENSDSVKNLLRRMDAIHFTK